MNFDTPPQALTICGEWNKIFGDTRHKRQAAPDCLIAGDLATLASHCDSWNPDNFEHLVAAYQRQIRGLIDGGADLLVGETLLYPQEAEAIVTAAELEGAGAVMISFTMQSDGSLFSGADAGKVLHELEGSGVDALGFNCVVADMMTDRKSVV